MNCPRCGRKQPKGERGVEDTRDVAGGSAIRRRRRCPAGHAWTTIEFEAMKVVSFVPVPAKRKGS